MMAIDQKIFIEKHRTLRESEDYAFLRKKGIEYIQELGSNIWTDYNIHDPGVTILEVLCYAITDLGYRTDYLMQDILAEDISDENADRKNFFSARCILPCNPVTFNDFRKIMIDVPGVKNAWIDIEKNPKPKLFVNCRASELTQTVPTTRERVISLHLQGLYTIILEFETDPELGEINRCQIIRTITDGEHSFDIEIILPAWDQYGRSHIVPQELHFGDVVSIPHLPKYASTLTVTLENGDTREFPVTIISQAEKTAHNTQRIQEDLTTPGQHEVLIRYQVMLKKAFLIVESVMATLHQHRNLCEDFLQFKGIEIEEIGICADLEVNTEADVENVLAEVYYQIGHFLAPTVKFYSIKELLDKGKTADEIFEGPVLMHGFIDEAELETSKYKIPIHASDHEDTASESSESQAIHVSDIIQIIMDVKGVKAVKNILLTNFYQGEPQTTGENWRVAIGAGRTTRLSIERSKIVLYKGLIPYFADQDDMQTKLKELLALDRQNKLGWDEYDLPIPEGKHRAIQTYYSIQHDFPLCYGIGQEGLPRSATNQRKAQAKQLNAYLLLYDQFLANYFAQLAHVKDLFSMNPEIKKTYFSRSLYELPGVPEPEIPNLPNLMKDFVETLDFAKIDIDDFSTYKSDWDKYAEDMKNRILADINIRDPLLESEDTYEERKNRFLDHLMARFGEQFTDYVLLMSSLDRKKAAAEVIADKLAFLQGYPEISRDRGKAYNYKNSNELWDTTNVSGLQKRVCRLLGIHSYARRSLSDCPDELDPMSEGFHLIEHILLRPRSENDQLLTVCVNEDCTSCSGFMDPYSFRMTAIVPSWPVRFQNLDFRRFFEATLRLEAPAHTYIKICWVALEAMRKFENSYLPWLQEMTKDSPNREIQKACIKELESLRSVYPEARLYDCNTQDKRNAVLLNHTFLGTHERNEDETK